MIKRGLKNYFICLKYIFIPLGTIFLGIIFGLSVLLPLVSTACNTLIDETLNVLQEVSVEPQAFLSDIFDRVLELDWGNPLQAAKELISQEWLEGALKDGVIAAFGGEQVVSAYAGQINGAVNSAMTDVMTGVSLFIFFVCLGVISGYFILKFQIRKQIAARAFWKMFLAAFADFVIVSALTALCVWLASLWTFSLIFTLIFSVLTMGGVALAEAYIVHGLGKIKFKEVFTLKNIVLLVLTNFIIFIIWLAISAVLVCFVNRFAGVVIGLVLLELTAIVTGLNAEAFVKNYAENKKQP